MKYVWDMEKRKGEHNQDPEEKYNQVWEILYPILIYV